MTKRLLSIITAILMSMILIVGCGTNSNEAEKETATEANGESNSNEVADNETDEKDNGEEQASETDASDSNNDESFTITVASWNLADEPSGIIEAYRASFESIYKEKYPNATIEYHNTPGDKYFDVLKAQMASNSAADVVQFQTNELGLFAKADFILDLSEMALVDSMSGAPLDLSSYKGKIYGIPFDLSSHGVWYSKELFSEYGVEVPTTWDEFLSVCETFKSAGITPIAGGFKDAWVASMTMNMFLTNDYGSSDFELSVYDGSKKLAGPELEASFMKVQTLIDNGYFGDDALSNGWDLQRQGFEQGESAMIMHGSYMGGLANLETAEQGGMETGFFPVPNDNGAPVISVGIGTLTGVNASTEHPERAKDLIAAMYSVEASTVRMKDAGMFPALNGIEIDYPLTGDNEFLTAVGSNASVVGGRYIPGSVKDLLGQNFTKMLSGVPFEEGWLNELDTVYENDKSLVAPPE